jgi:hypothetical protein
MEIMTTEEFDERFDAGGDVSSALHTAVLAQVETSVRLASPAGLVDHEVDDDQERGQRGTVEGEGGGEPDQVGGWEVAPAARVMATSPLSPASRQAGPTRCGTCPQTNPPVTLPSAAAARTRPAAAVSASWMARAATATPMTPAPAETPSSTASDARIPLDRSGCHRRSVPGVVRGGMNGRRRDRHVGCAAEEGDASGEEGGGHPHGEPGPVEGDQPASQERADPRDVGGLLTGEPRNRLSSRATSSAKAR